MTKRAITAPLDPNADLIGYEYKNAAGRTFRVTGTASWGPAYVNLDIIDTDDGDTIGQGCIPVSLVRQRQAA